MDAEEDDDIRSLLGAATSSLGDDDQEAAPQQRELHWISCSTTSARSSKPSIISQWSTPYLLYFWEVADAHQLLQSSLQCLSNSISASDASCAPSTSADSTIGSSRARKRRQDAIDESSSVLPLVQSIKELAECQRQLVFDRGEERRHEHELDQHRETARTRELHRERIFRRRAELLDLARQYRKLNAELGPTDENSARLSEFYVNEGHLLEEELQNLESSI